MAQRTSQGVMDRASALPSGTAQPALPLAEALARCNPDQRAPSPALAREDVLYATRPKPPAQLIRATRSRRAEFPETVELPRSEVRAGRSGIGATLLGGGCHRSRCCNRSMGAEEGADMAHRQRNLGVPRNVV